MFVGLNGRFKHVGYSTPENTVFGYSGLKHLTTSYHIYTFFQKSVFLKTTVPNTEHLLILWPYISTFQTGNLLGRDGDDLIIYSTPQRLRRQCLSQSPAQHLGREAQPDRAQTEGVHPTAPRDAT